MTGRVVDFQGTPVSNAEVILLGEERMIVDVNPPRVQNSQKWYAISPQRGSASKPKRRQRGPTSTVKFSFRRIKWIGKSACRDR